MTLLAALSGAIQLTARTGGGCSPSPCLYDLRAGAHFSTDLCKPEAVRWLITLVLLAIGAGGGWVFRLNFVVDFSQSERVQSLVLPRLALARTSPRTTRAP